MNSRTIIFGAATAAVVIALGLLVLKVKAAPEIVVDEERVAAAAREHKRSRVAPPSPTPPIATPEPRPELQRDPPDVPPEPAEPRLRVPSLSAPMRPEIKLNTEERSDMLKASLDAANKLYDRGDYEGAQAAALTILEEDPSNIRMLRIVVSTGCIMGEEEEARAHFDKLPVRDQRQLKRRCKHYGIDFETE